MTQKNPINRESLDSAHAILVKALMRTANEINDDATSTQKKPRVGEILTTFQDEDRCPPSRARPRN